jgi:hypothetical protein
MSSALYPGQVQRVFAFNIEGYIRNVERICNAFNSESVIYLRFTNGIGFGEFLDEILKLACVTSGVEFRVRALTHYVRIRENMILYFYA